MLNLPPLHIVVEREARLAAYRLRNNNDWRGDSHSRIIDTSMSEPTLGMVSDKMVPRFHFHKPFETRIEDQSKWEERFNTLERWSLVWFTDGSKMTRGTGAGIYGLRPRWSASYSLGEFPTVFQAEIFAIMACLAENVRRGYRRKLIYIFSDSQAAIKALAAHKVSSKLVWDCLQMLTELATNNTVRLCWVPGHKGICGNEKADELARKGSETEFIGPEPFCGTSPSVVKRALGKWTETEHRKYWTSRPGHSHSKELMEYPSKGRANELLSLNRIRLRRVTGLITGHCHFRKHLHKLKLVDSPVCRGCESADETSLHILGECPGFARSRMTLLGRPYLEPKELREVSARKLLDFVKRTNLLAE